MDVTDIPKTWQDAFQSHSIPVVRAIEKQLRAGVSRDKERLRTLVGGNYRDLLSTADEIVALDQHTRETEAAISGLSRSCKPPQYSLDPRPVAALSSISAQLHLLRQCTSNAILALQNRDTLLCAQLTVVSRLLLKALGEQDPVPSSSERFREKAAALRRRLLRLIDSHLSHPASSTDILVRAICAYCLVTSASSGDAVKRFREARLDKLRQRIQLPVRSHLSIKEDFRYLVISVTSLKSLLGRSVNEALGALQKQPILQDPGVAKIDTLDIDRLGNLIPKDILAFTPYIKRVLLKKEEVQEIAGEWADDASQIFFKGLEGTLAGTESIDDVFGLRRDLLSILLPSYFSIPAQQKLLASVRQTTNSRILTLCKTQIDTLVQIGHDIASVKTAPVLDSSLWSPTLVKRPLNVDGARYAHQVQAIHLGIQGDLGRSIKKLKRWARNVSQLREQIHTIGTARWQDLLEEPDDEDEEAAEEVISQLSKDDPSQFQSAMKSSVHDAVTQFNGVLHEAATQVTKTIEIEDSDVANISHLIRSLRESSSILATVLPDPKLDTGETAAELHDALAGRVTLRITASLKQNPPLTTTASPLPEELPSPQTFRFLRNVCQTMAETGQMDIWSAVAVSVFKAKLYSTLLDKEDRPSFIQTDFDEHLLRAALGKQPDTKPVRGVDDIQSKAVAYWLRTRLLFGVLA